MTPPPAPPVAADAPTSRRVPLETGLSYHLLEWNAGRGLDHTVILLHGFLDLAWGWQRVVRAGLGDVHVVAPDMRGHGDSDRVGAGGYYHFFDYLADVDALVRAVGAARVSLVGHSMGGAIAAYYTGAFPRRIHRLALLEGLGPPEQDTPVPDRIAAWIDGWRGVRQRPRRSYADVAEAAQRLRERDPLLAEDLARELAERGTVATADGRRAFKHDPLHTTAGPYPFQVDVAETFWRRITCPVLLVRGGLSELTQRVPDLDRRAACFAHAERVTIEGAGHMMQRHRPARVAAALRAFLNADR